MQSYSEVCSFASFLPFVLYYFIFIDLTALSWMYRYVTRQHDQDRDRTSYHDLVRPSCLVFGSHPKQGSAAINLKLEQT